ncbi:MAG: P-II family nitrogen regulator [bacterium]
MKEIKVYFRTQLINELVKTLEEAGAPGMTVVEVHPVGYGFDPNYFEYSTDIRRLYPEITKLEIVCADEDVDKFVDVIQGVTHTGAKGDGMIFISDIGEAVRIRSGERGERAL